MSMALFSAAEQKELCPLPPARCSAHAWNRKRIGPTGRNVWMILVDDCWKCHLIRPVKRPLTYQQRRWVKRWNNKIVPNEKLSHGE